MHNPFVRIVSVAVLVASTGAASLAREPADDHPLSGPKVEDRSAPGVNPTLDGGQRDRRSRGGERNRPALFMGAVMSLARPDTPEGLRLTDEQRAEAEAIGKEYADALRKFRNEHRAELEQLHEGRERAGDQRRPQRPDDLTPEQQEKAAKRRAVMEQAPRPDPYQARLWALLSPEQQTLATDRLNDMKSRAPDEMRDRRRERDTEDDRPRRGDRREQGAPPPPRRGADDEQGPRAEGRFSDRGPPPRDRGVDRPVTFDDLRTRLDRMPPEMRERAMRRIMESLDRLEERAPRNRPAPPMREVEVPPGA